MAISGEFLDLPAQMADPATAKFAVIPVPYDGTSTWLKGADRGPAAILGASAAVEWLDIQTGMEACREGIMTLSPLAVADLSPEVMAERVRGVVAEQLSAGRVPIVLGGEHSVSIGAIQSTAAWLPPGQRLGVLQVDAHADTRDSYEGSTYNHACVMARAREVADIVQVGIRSLDASEKAALDENRVFYAHDIHRQPNESWMDRAVSLLPEQVYLTIDVDGFDPSLVPATGTPEPGGLDWYTVNELVRRVLASGRKIVAFDVTELMPRPGLHASNFLVAKLVYRIISMQVAASAR